MIYAVIILILTAAAALGAPPPGADPALHAWFERQHSVEKQWCCDVADGHVLTDSEWRAAGRSYEVRVDGAWLPVPDGALRDPAGGPNPTGRAIVWYTKNAFGVRVYCFAPGTEY